MSSGRTKVQFIISFVFAGFFNLLMADGKVSYQFPADGKKWCGTEHGLSDDEYISELRQFAELVNKGIDNLRDTYFIRVQFHIVRQDDGSGGLNPSLLWPVLEAINGDYSNAGLYFYHPGEVNFINSVKNVYKFTI